MIEIILSTENLLENKSKKISREKGNSLIKEVNDYVVIDLETTGLSPFYDEILEIGLVRVTNNTVSDTFVSTFFYNNYIDQYITDLTGITNETLKNSPKFENKVNDIIEFIGEDILVGHNVNFDINFLYDKLYMYDHILNNDYIDTLRIARRVLPDLKNHKLSTLLNYYNIKENEHRALSDALLTNRLYENLLKTAKDNNIELNKTYKSNSNSFRVSQLTANKDKLNPDHIFYNSNICFTGKLSVYSRKEASQILLDIGANPQDGVTKKTDYLVIGSFDEVNNLKGNKSSKQKKAENLIIKGSDLKILDEFNFYNLLIDDFKN